MKNKNRILKTVETAVLAALGVVFMFVIRFPLLPSAGFLEYDMGDIPVIAAALLLGPGAGTAVLFIVALVQSLTVSAASSWQGFLMHFISTELFILALSVLNKKLSEKNNISSSIGMVISLFVSTVLMTAVMIPLNLIFTPMYLKVPVQAVEELLLPAIIPFNLLKGVINSFIIFLLYFPLKKTLEKSKLLPKK